ncbi:MAG TPA: PIN domain-containing protein, partial [Candidatus Nanoarchaeia archaeon]|nr:PIN domain-containing protein [Candidatus Nanoarchaeia archaeon]
MTKFVVDASAWIDYFDESERGKRLAKILESDDSELFTSAATVAEVVSKFLRRKFPPENAVNAIISLSNVLDVTSDIAWETGKIHSEVKK